MNDRLGHQKKRKLKEKEYYFRIAITELVYDLVIRAEMSRKFRK